MLVLVNTVMRILAPWMDDNGELEDFALQELSHISKASPVLNLPSTTPWRQWRYCSIILDLSTTWSGELHALVALSPRIPRFLLYRRLDGIRSRSGSWWVQPCLELNSGLPTCSASLYRLSCPYPYTIVSSPQFRNESRICFNREISRAKLWKHRGHQETTLGGAGFRQSFTESKNKLCGLSPRANYTDRGTAACRQS
jgi:hypothetical protein